MDRFCCNDFFIQVAQHLISDHRVFDAGDHFDRTITVHGPSLRRCRLAIVGIDHQGVEAKALFPPRHHLINPVHHEICSHLALSETQVLVSGLRQQNTKRGELHLGIQGDP